MSTLAAARADNFYYPPGWTPEAGSISKFAGSKGKNQYEQYGVIRFELPYHSWCEGCGRHIGKGVRFNAKKEKAGKYFSTQIWEFQMTCPSCSNKIIIRTDPKNTDYEYVSGIRKKITEYDPKDIELETMANEETSQKIAADPIFKLEHAQDDQRVAESRKSTLTRLTEWSDDVRGDDFATNSALRRNLRARKKEDAAREAEAERLGLGIKLLDKSPADQAQAALVRYKSKFAGFGRSEKVKLAAIRGQSIFASVSTASASGRHQQMAAASVTRDRMGIRTSLLKLSRKSALASSASSDPPPKRQRL